MKVINTYVVQDEPTGTFCFLYETEDGRFVISYRAVYGELVIRLITPEHAAQLIK